ncbi:Protein kinase-like domain superfamily [Sesbania bispinosa]|nr:Protein kinase-like domain superfamily [Sesbania bispinosa]
MPESEKLMKAVTEEFSAVVILKKIVIIGVREGFPGSILREVSFLKELNHPNIVKSLRVISVNDKYVNLGFKQLECNCPQNSITGPRNSPWCIMWRSELQLPSVSHTSDIDNSRGRDRDCHVGHKYSQLLRDRHREFQVTINSKFFKVRTAKEKIGQRMIITTAPNFKIKKLKALLASSKIQFQVRCLGDHMQRCDMVHTMGTKEAKFSYGWSALEEHRVQRNLHRMWYHVRHGKNHETTHAEI